MENVDRAEKSNTFAEAREVFKSAGYGITQMVLDASLCGVPQKRKRFFCIGALNEKTILQKTFAGKNIGTRDNVKRILW